MPAKCRYNKDGPPGKKYEIYNANTGKVYGHSATKAKCESSANARNAASHGWEPTNK